MYIILKGLDKQEWISTTIGVNIYCPFAEHLSTCGNWCPQWDKWYNGSNWVVTLHCTKNEIKIDDIVEEKWAGQA